MADKNIRIMIIMINHGGGVVNMVAVVNMVMMSTSSGYQHQKGEEW